MSLTPKEITKDSLNREFAFFDYSTGMHYVREHNLKPSIYYYEVAQGSHYLVTCGYVAVKVSSTDYPDIQRKLL